MIRPRLVQNIKKLRGSNFGEASVSVCPNGCARAAVLHIDPLSFFEVCNCERATIIMRYAIHG